MNSGSPPSATAVNGREPFASTGAGLTRATGRPAEPSAAAISAGVRATKIEAAELTDATEGWPVGLYLAALSLQEQRRSTLPQHRRAWCPWEYIAVRKSFERYIRPHVDEAKLAKVKSMDWLRPDDGR